MTHLSVCVLIVCEFIHNVMLLLTAALGESLRYTHCASILNIPDDGQIPMYIIPVSILSVLSKKHSVVNV